MFRIALTSLLALPLLGGIALAHGRAHVETGYGYTAQAAEAYPPAAIAAWDHQHMKAPDATGTAAPSEGATQPNG